MLWREFADGHLHLSKWDGQKFVPGCGLEWAEDSVPAPMGGLPYCSRCFEMRRLPGGNGA